MQPKPKIMFLPAAKPAGLCFANVTEGGGTIWLAVVLAVVLAVE